MKEQQRVIAAAAKTIAAAGAKRERINAERTKIAAARDALYTGLERQRADAAHALALATLGDGDEASANDLQAKVEASERSLLKAEQTLASLDTAERQLDADVAEAEASQAAARAQIHDQRDAEAVARFLDAAGPFIAAHRHLRARERARALDGLPAVTLLRAGDIRIPAPHGYQGQRFGAFNELLYVGDHNHERFDGGPQFEALNDEIEALARLGVEV